MSFTAAPFRVLVIDDESLIADTLGKIFTSVGYDARGVNSAEAALNMISEWTPHLAIIDVFLPGLNGIELAILLTTKHAEIKVLLFSGQAGTAALLEMCQKGGYAFEILAKPVHPTTMLSTASRLLLSGHEEERP
jgi:DNA-binding NtrC family response regulator